MTELNNEDRKKYIWENIGRAFLYLIFILVIYLIINTFFVNQLENWIEFASTRKNLMFGLFFLNELAFGLLPPEIFFVIFPKEDYTFFEFTGIMLLMTVMSYFAITIIYLFGRLLGEKGNLRLFNQNWYLKYKEKLDAYGSILLFLGCVTPIPCGVVSLLAGSQSFSFSKFLLISLTRIIRFVGYGWAVYFFM